MQAELKHPFTLRDPTRPIKFVSGYGKGNGRWAHEYTCGQRVLPGITKFIYRTFCHEDFNPLSLCGKSQKVTNTQGVEVPISKSKGSDMGKQVDKEIVSMTTYYQTNPNHKAVAFYDTATVHPFTKDIEAFLRRHPKPRIKQGQAENELRMWIPVAAQVHVADTQIGLATSIDLIVRDGDDLIAIEVKCGRMGSFEMKLDPTLVGESIEAHRRLKSPFEAYPADVKHLGLIQIFLGIKMFGKTYTDRIPITGFVMSVNTEGIKLAGYSSFVRDALMHIQNLHAARMAEKAKAADIKKAKEMLKEIQKIAKEQTKLVKKQQKITEKLAKESKKQNARAIKQATAASAKTPRKKKATEGESKQEPVGSATSLTEALKMASELGPGNFVVAPIHSKEPIEQQIQSIKDKTFADANKWMEQEFQRDSVKRKKSFANNIVLKRLVLENE